MLTRRRLLATAAAAPPAAALAASGTEPALAARAKAASAAGKNILIFITDQQRKTMHFPAGWEEENLPGLTRLKQNGVSFENAFCNSAMCSPSRATLFSGLYPAKHGVKYTLEEDMPSPQYPQVELSTELVNLASVMSAAGYEVVYKGKWHLSKPIGDDWSPEDLAQYGFSRWAPPDGGMNQDIDQAGGGITDLDGTYMNADGDAEDGSDEGVLKFINSRAGASQPWCLVVALVNPHDTLLYPGPPNMSPPKYVQAGYDDPAWLEGEIGLPLTFNEDLSTKPRCQAQFAKLFGASGPLTDREMKLSYLNFYGNLLKLVDGYLVDILDALDATDQLNNTLVVRTADHGEMALAHTMRQKSFNAYEETIAMPLVFSNPDMYKQERRSQQIVSHVDLLPTLASLVDAPSEARSPDWQGIDYSEHVLGVRPEPTQDHVVFTFDDWQSGQSQGPYIPAPNHIVAIRERRWKLAKYYDETGTKPTQWEMYDLKKDPLERWNLAHRPSRMTPFQKANFQRLKRRIHHIEETKLQPPAAG